MGKQNTRHLGIRISYTLLKKIQKIAEQEGRNTSEVIRQALVDFVDIRTADITIDDNSNVIKKLPPV